MGKASRDKGSRVERELAAKLTAAGVPTRRVIGSGAHGGIDSRLRGDLQIGTLESGAWLLTGEVKARKDGAGFTTLDGWLGDNDLLLLKRNNSAPCVYMPWNTFQAMLYAFYKEKTTPVTLGELMHLVHMHCDPCDATEEDAEIMERVMKYLNQEYYNGNNTDSSSNLPGDECVHGGAE